MLVGGLRTAFTPLLLTLLSKNALLVGAQSLKCTGGNGNFASPSKGQCIQGWSRGNDYEYDKDFEGILNKVTIYTCPFSKKRVIISNGIPDHNVRQGNNNSPCETNWAISIPLNPIKSIDPVEIPPKGIIAIATNGVPAYGAKEVDDMNAVEPDGLIQDAQFWYGHATMNNIWHLHNPYMGQEDAVSTTLLGWALDGFPIYGPLPTGATGLDGCNGRTVNGNYQYHVLDKQYVAEDLDYCKAADNPETNWNYILGCYHGTTADTQVVDSISFTVPPDCIEDGSPTPAPVGTPDTPTDAPTDTSPTKGDIRPNIIVMQPDDMAFFDIWGPPPNNPTSPKSGVDEPQTNGLPHMETLRKNGLQMMQAYTASPACGTSRYSTITGKYPSRAASSRKNNSVDLAGVTIPATKLVDEGNEKDCSRDNVAAALRDNGYRTGMVGKWHLSKIKDSDYSYSYAVDEVKKCGFDFVDALYIENIDADPNSFDNYSDGSFSHNMEFVTYEAINFINSGEDPFFLYFNPTVPHSSQPVESALNQFTCQDTPRKDPNPTDFVIEGMTKEFGGSCELYRADVQSRADTVDDLGSIWVDDSVGALLLALKKKNVLDNTIFIFQQDHGVETKMALYENGNRIAQFIHFPAEYGPGMQYDAPVSTVDIAATLLDFAEVSPTYFMDGKSWRNDVPSLALPNSNADRCIFFEMEFDRAVRCGCHKFLAIDENNKQTSKTYRRGKMFGYSVDYKNLFDLCGGTGYYTTDSETNEEASNLNLAAVDPPMADKMEGVLQCHLDRTVHSAPIGDNRRCELNPATPTAAPTTSPIGGQNPTNAPEKPPTSAPNTPPTAAPIDTIGCTQEGNDRFLFKLNKKNGKPKLKKCQWLEGRPDNKKRGICRKKVDYFGTYSPPQDICKVSCNSCDPCYENGNSKFFFRLKPDNTPMFQKCKWLAKRTNAKKLCRNKTGTHEGYGNPGDLCPVTCGVSVCAV